MNKTILVPVDFKQPSADAASYGCKMAEKIDAGMILLMTHQEGYTYDNYIGAFAHHILNLSNISVLSITSVKNNLDFAPFFNSLVDPMGVLMRGER